ncbi:MAG: DUF167 domain-containing protein [Candidatus Wallbacteria bacterium]|nr:DUF167 domain-containing protein [Candidatus Wallbacteria bacterium]
MASSPADRRRPETQDAGAPARRVAATATAQGVLLPVKVIPRARAAGVEGELGGALKLKLTSPPVNNKANSECQSVVAELFGLRRGDVEIVRGGSSRQKTLLLRGVSLEHVQGTLARVLAGRS